MTGDEAALQAAQFRSERLGELQNLASSISDLFLLVLGQESASELVDEPRAGLLERRERPRMPKIPRAPLED